MVAPSRWLCIDRGTTDAARRRFAPHRRPNRCRFTRSIVHLLFNTYAMDEKTKQNKTKTHVGVEVPSVFHSNAIVGT